MFWKQIIEWWGESVLNDESFYMVQLAAMKADTKKKEV